ncbi:fungal-specific transcription factor domain-containing protein [Tricladium varicosporioides]|nr:fungal-specific transcription factor domain-containing protein [Hymenoscyphus varicosporioides]
MELSNVVCTSCRQRKVKCDRHQPSCGFCKEIGTDCIYTHTQKKRGLRAGYVSSLEKRLEKLEEEVQALKSNQHDLRLAQATSPPSHSNHDPALFVTSPGALSHHSDRSGIELDLLSLPQGTLIDLCKAWFERYHPWFPILHKLSVLGEIQSIEPLNNSPLLLVLKAIVSVTLPHWSLSSPLSREERRKLSDNFREQIILQAISNLSLQSLQAVLIVTIIDYGAGKLSEFWNLVALCKRMGVQLGLRDLVANQGDNFNKVSTLPPRMLPIPTSLIEQEEKIRAYWMTEVLDSMSSLGAGWNLSLSRPENEAWFPCNETVWAFPENATAFSSFGDTEVSNAFSIYLNLVTHQLYQVHVFLQQSYDATSAVDRTQWQAQCVNIDEYLNKWRESELSTPILSLASADSTTILSAVTFNTAIIALYQRLALPPKGLGEVHGPWYHAIQRCLSACDEMSTIIRGITDADLENMSPHMIFCIFVAARFYIVHAKILSVEIPRSLDLLIYGLKTYGQRWYFAQRLVKVIYVAITEKQMPVGRSTLPVQFYDLQYSSLDIDHALSLWADEGLVAEG